MDFVRLVNDEKYPWYKKEQLNEDDYEFIDGIEHAMVLINTWRDNQEYDEESIFEKIRQECVLDAVEEMKEYIYCKICQYIVEMIDNYEEDDTTDITKTTCPTTL